MSTIQVNNIQRVDGTESFAVDSDGSVTFAADLNLGDNNKAIFGTTSDGLQIYNTSSGDKIINEAGSGNLKVQGDNLYLQNSAGTENHIISITGGAVTLHYNASSKLATTATGIDVTGTVTADGLAIESSSVSTIYASTNQLLNLRDTSAYSIGSNGATLNFQGNDSGTNIRTFSNLQGRSVGFDTGSLVAQTRAGGSLYDRFKIDYNGDISFYEDTGTTAKFYWDASTERLGIGTTSPAVKLQVVSNSDTDYNPATAALNTILSLNNGTSGTLNNALISFATETNGEWYIGGVQNSSNDASDFIFTSRDSGTRAERMRITGNGKVGIGTDSPLGTLDLFNSSQSTLLTFRSGNGQATIYFRDASSNLKGQIESQNDGTMWITTRASAPIQFGINNSERMRIDSSGNVGIGINPGYALDFDAGITDGQATDAWVKIGRSVMCSGSFSGTYAIRVEFTDVGASSYVIEILAYGYSGAEYDYLAGEYMNHGGLEVIRNNGQTVTHNQSGSTISFQTGDLVHASYMIRISLGGAGNAVDTAAPIVSLV